MRRDSDVRVGRTIAGEWERQESESERLAARKKAKSKKIIKVLILLVVLGTVAAVITMEVTTWMVNRKKIETARYVPQPTVNIIDESGQGITNKIKEYVGQLEIDLKDIGLTLNRVVVPIGKNREIDIYIDVMTNCLVFAETGEECDTEYRLVVKQITKWDAMQLKSKGWKFDWSVPQQNGNEGYVQFTAKTNLVSHYIQMLNAKCIDRHTLYIESQEAATLVKRYFKEGE